MRSPRIEIYRSTRVLSVKALEDPDNPEHTRQEYRWRHRASNGRIVSESGEGYIEPRNLVRGLEIAHPGFRLSWSEEEQAWAMALDVWSFPVAVPEGTESLWVARRNR